MKTAFLDKLIDRLDKLDPGSLQTHFLRLAREKGLLETIFNAVREGLIVLDGAARVVYANRAAATMLGLPREGVEGQPIRRHRRDMDEESYLTTPERRQLFYKIRIEGPASLKKSILQGGAIVVVTVYPDRVVISQE